MRFSLTSSVDFFEQVGLVDLIRQLEDDQAGLAGLLVFLDLDPGAHVDLAAAGGIGLADAGGAVDAGGGSGNPARQVRIRPSRSICGSSIIATQALTTSTRLCGGYVVAMPTAIPVSR